MPMYQTKTIAGILEPVAQQVNPFTTQIPFFRFYNSLATLPMSRNRPRLYIVVILEPVASYSLPHCKSVHIVKFSIHMTYE
jgi:hypothetical protein